MQANDPKYYETLLQVFYTGLVKGFITKQEVTAWADGVIMANDEPDYFFIELSLSSNVNDVCAVISYKVDVGLTTISSRAVIARLYGAYLADVIDLDVVDNVLYCLTYGDVLSSDECKDIYQIGYFFEECEDSDLTSQVFCDFGKKYNGLEMDNYDQWPDINIAIESKLLEEKQKQVMPYNTVIPEQRYKGGNTSSLSTGSIIRIVVFALWILAITSRSCNL